MVLKVTGSTICGSDLHLYHGSIITLQQGDILGHEFCGVVDSVGPNVRDINVGDRVVASFQIACGKCRYCREGLSSMCDRTNGSEVENVLHGQRIAGLCRPIYYQHLFILGPANQRNRCLWLFTFDRRLCWWSSRIRPSTVR